MERIKVHKVRKGLAGFFIIFGTIFTLLGAGLLIKCFISGFNSHFPSGDWNSVIFTIEGPLFILIGYSNLRSNKYFIEWDENEMRYLLPQSKSVETILFTDINQVSIKLFEIELILTGNIITLHLENLQFEDLRKIKSKFEEFKVKSFNT